MKKTLGQQLEIYRTDLGWDLTQAAGETLFELTAQSIGRIEKGTIKNPGYHTLAKMLKSYSKTFAELESDLSCDVAPVNKSTDLLEPGYKVPVINLVDVSDFLDGGSVEIIEYVSSLEKPSKNVFAVRMSNDFMNSINNITYPKNSIVVFDPTKRFKNNTDILVNTDNGVVFRRVTKEGELYYLSTLNPNSPGGQLTGEFNALARAVRCEITTV